MNGVVLSDSRFQHADLGAGAAGLDKHGVLLNGKNSADAAAVGDNLISNLNAVEHVLLTKIMVKACSYFYAMQWQNGQLNVEGNELQSMLKSIEVIQKELVIS